MVTYTERIKTMQYLTEILNEILNHEDDLADVICTLTDHDIFLEFFTFDLACGDFVTVNGLSDVVWLISFLDSLKVSLNKDTISWVMEMYYDEMLFAAARTRQWLFKSISEDRYQEEFNVKFIFQDGTNNCPSPYFMVKIGNNTLLINPMAYKQENVDDYTKTLGLVTFKQFGLLCPNSSFPDYFVQPERG